MSAALYLCLHLRDFAAQAMEFAHLELRRRPLAILSGTAPLEYVFAVNQQARELGVERGIGRLQAESFAGLAIWPRQRALEERAFAHLVECAGRFSPRIEIIAVPQENSSDATLVLDIANSSRLLGRPEQIAKAIEREIGAAILEVPQVPRRVFSGANLGHSNPRVGGFKASIAVSCNASAAVLAARGNAGITMIPSGQEAQMLAPLPLQVLQPDEEQAATLASWGIRTLGQLAALPSRSLAARLGQSGLRLQSQARGQYDHLLVPTEASADAPLNAEIELEHPVELLEPLLLLVNQLLQQVLEAAQQRALAIASLELSLKFEGGPHLPAVGKCGGQHEEHRTIRPALPERDPAVLLKLIQLELELRPPAAGVVGLRMVAHPARPQRAQQGLFAAQAPEPGRMAVLLARLRKLVGEGRFGSPELLDSRAADAFRMAPFLADAAEEHSAVAEQNHSPALRMLRPPREVAIELRRGAPVAMRCDGQRRTVHASSGPWRTSGEWWTQLGWCREEWEIVLEGAAQEDKLQNATIHDKTFQNEALRLAHDPANGGWYVIGIYD